MERGYVILEMILLLAVVSIAVGAAVTVYEQQLTSDFIEESEEEMGRIVVACEKYYADMGAFPASLDELLNAPPGGTGWMGPYLDDTFAVRVDAGQGILQDAWGEAYEISPTGAWTAEIVSLGPDGTASSDDLTADVDVHDTAWKTTRWELRVLQPAVTAYILFSAPPQLSAQWKNALSKLQQAGFVPSGQAEYARFLQDGWGQDYVTVGNPVESVDTAGPPQGGGN